MTLKQQNPWKLFSVGLLGIIAVGLLAPVSAAPPSGNSDSQLEELFNLVNEILVAVQGIDTDLEDISGNVTAIKTETDKIQMIKDDVGAIKTDVTTLVSSGSGTFRISHSFDDGDDNEYDGILKIDRTTGSGVFQIEKLYICDLRVGEDTGDDRLRIKYSVDGQLLENPDSVIEFLNDYNSGPVTDVNPGCIDVLYANVLNGDVHLAGDGSNDVVLTLDESDVDGVEADDDGAEIVAYISGLSDASDITITSTTGAS